MIRASLFLFCLLLLGGCGDPQPPRQESVKPGINDSYTKDLNVDEYVGRFEGESRDVYQHRRTIVRHLGIKPGMKVADIGAGTGFFAILLAEAVGPEGHVYAVDIAPEFLDLIEARAQKAGLTNITTVLGRDDSVELKKDSVDLAFICDTYHHFEHPARVMWSVRQALKPRGEVAIIEFHREEGVSRDWILDHVRAGQDQVFREFDSFGFDPLDSPELTFLKEKYLARFRSRS